MQSSTRLFWIYLAGWFPMVLIAILNGGIRETVYTKRLGELRAHQLSTLTGATAFGVYIWGMSRFWPLQSGSQALGAGLMWLAMTVAFEFLFGRFGAKKSWRELLADYNLFAGRVWTLLLAWVAVSPYVFWRLAR